MEIIAKLKDQGWYLLDDGIKKLPEDVDKSDTRKIIQAAMDMDFREIAGGALPTDLSRKDEAISGRIVLQISKIRNIAAPKADEENNYAPRLFQLELTDGVNQVQALEIEYISALSFNTPPGTKIYLKCEKIPLMQGMLMLKSNDVQVLGGRVAHLLEKWEMSRTLLKYAKGGRVMNGGSSGPPPWTPFGQRIQQQNVNAGNDKNFKSLAAANEKEGKENNEFVAMRKEAIAEAAKAGSKKVFGGGNQPIVDHNVKKILEKGYSEEEAKNALRATRNNLERALFNLKRREESKNKDDSKSSGYDKSKSGVTINDRSSLNSSKRGPNSNARDNFSNKKGGKDDVVPTKPAGNVSLFDFLTDKLPSNSNETEKSSISTSQSQQHFGGSSSSNQQHSQQSSRHESRTERISRPSDSYSSSNSRPSHYNNSSNNSNSQQQQSSYTESRNQNSQQNQHHIPNSQSNRNSLGQKFENNLSSSFQANRNYSQDNERPRNRNNRESTERSGSSNNAGSNRNYQNSYQGRSGGNSGNDRQYDDQNSERYYNSRDQRNNTYNQRNTKSQQGNERDNRSGGNERNNYQTSSTSHFQYHQHQNNSGSNYDNNRNSRNDNQSYRNGYDNTRNSGASGSYQNKNNHSQISSSRYSQKDNTTNAYQQNQSQSQGPNNARNYSDNRQQSYHQQQQSNQNSEAKVNKIIEDTSKLKIDQPPQHQQQQPSQQQQQQQQQHSQKPRHNQNAGSHRNQNMTYQQQPQQHMASQHQPQIMTVVSHQGPPPNQPQISQHTVQSSQQQQHPHFQPPPQVHSAQHSLQTSAFTQIPNGFAYDPNKIMGFQNKETNDFAMTLLKSQGIPTALTPTTALAPPQPPHPHPSVTPTAAPQSTTPHPAAAYQTMQIGHPPPPTINQHSFAAPGPAFVMQPTSIAPPPQLATIGPQVAHTHTSVAAGIAASLQGPPQQNPGAPYNMNHCESWNWKIGDRCIAKYWDDGRYYEAEITGISDKTCVVFYLGYGNHEEVLKTDCLPISDAQIRAINFGTTAVGVAIPQQQPPPGAVQLSAASRGLPNRYRSDRQMYVPPPKRDG
ncbi:tudor domain-containing protein 3 [Condylostylus longicornis]|uniref:tudor domain-containing protein 3 n=1 Tax=Condylostylus longicornis TaxID=2530218 RepID=UPI00244DA1E2|nr:tudor domain-containing protein 3 [Condylostylus longicornis]